MKEYVCDDCGAIFDEPEIVRWNENHGEGMIEPWALCVCPVCGSEEVERLKEN